MNHKNMLALLLCLLLALSLFGCTGETQPQAQMQTPEADDRPPVSTETSDEVIQTGLSPEVRKAAADLVKQCGKNSYGYQKTAYIVSDLGNTITIFDLMRQGVIYQLTHMAFAMDPAGLEAALSTGLDPEADESVGMWIADIVTAYTALYEAYGPFTAAGLEEQKTDTVLADPQWREFATKMRAFLTRVESAGGEAAGDEWMLWWFSGMTEQEVYDLFYRCCVRYQDVESQYVTWTSPEEIESQLGVVECTFLDGCSVPQETKELLGMCVSNGIDVWLCSSAHVDAVRAAVDAFGLGDVVTGVIGMTPRLDAETLVYTTEYDTETDYAYLNLGEGVWERTESAANAMPVMEGKVKAVQNVLMPRYGGCGPVAAFMDSGDDFHLCTEFDSLRLVVCFNRADRRITDGAGLIAVAAAFQQEVLEYDLASAGEEGDTLYLLQGRDENGMRALRASDHSLRLGQEEPSLFANEDNQLLMDYARKHRLSTQQLIDGFCIATPARDFGNLLGVDHGYLTQFSGYHSIPDEMPMEGEATA